MQSELPTLSDFSLTAPIYIRKLDARSHWNPEGTNGNLNERATLAAEKVFKEKNRVCCFWLVTTDLEFYGMVAAISTDRSPQDQNIDFIGIFQDELDEASIHMKQVPEGECLRVQNLHYEADISEDVAKNLCLILMEKQIETSRCKRAQTKLILGYQRKINCKALIQDPSLPCQCQNIISITSPSSDVP